jgi:hypothetical protein
VLWGGIACSHFCSCCYPLDSTTERTEEVDLRLGCERFRVRSRQDARPKYQYRLPKAPRTSNKDGGGIVYIGRLLLSPILFM